MDTLLLGAVWALGVAVFGRRSLSLYVVSFTVSAGYELGLTTTRGQTLGKMLMRVRVVRVEDAKRQGLHDKAVRTVVVPVERGL